MSCSWTALFVVEQLLLFAVPCRSRAHFSLRPVATEAEANSTFSLRCACAIVRDEPNRLANVESEADLDYVVPTILWLKNNVLLTDIDDPLTSLVSVINGLTIDSVITIADAQQQHCGTYTCVCLDEADKQELAIATSCSVALIQQPLVSVVKLVGTQWVAVENGSQIDVATEATLALRCRLQSTGNATLVWLHNGVRLDTAGQLASEVTLKLDGALEQDTGTYSCSASNTAGFSVATVQVQVGAVSTADSGTETFTIRILFAAEDFAVLEVSPWRSVSICLETVHSRVSRHSTDGTHTILSNLNSATTYHAWIAGSTCSARHSAVITFSTEAASAFSQHDDEVPMSSVQYAQNNDELMEVNVDKGDYLNVNWTTVSSLASCLFYEVFTELQSSVERHQVYDKYLLDGIRRNLRLSMANQQCATLSVVCHKDAESSLVRSAPVHICVGERNDTKRLVRQYREVQFSDPASDLQLFENSTAGLERDVTTLARPRWEKVLVNATTVSLSWSHRGPVPDDVAFWEVRYGPTEPDQFNLTVQAMNVTISGLQPGYVYVFSVSACNQHGCGAPIYESVVTDSVSESSQLLPPLQVVALTLNSTAVLVSWLDQSLNYRIRDSRYYSVRVTQVVVRAAPPIGDASSRHNAGDYLDAPADSRVRPEKQRYINTTDSKMIVDALRPFTEYEFEVSVHKGAVQSGWSMKAHNRTFEALPFQAPLDLQLALVGGGRYVELRWRQVPARHQNGIIRSYQVAYSTNDEHPDAKWLTENVNASLLTYVFKHLLPETGYYFKVRAKNSRGYGPFSDPVFIETKFGVRASPAQPASSTARGSVYDVTSRQVDEGKLHGIAFETWYIIIGCATGISIVVFIVVTVSVVKKRRRSAEIQRRKAEYVSRRLSGQPGSVAVSSHSSSASSSKASSTNTNKKCSPTYSAAAYQYTPVKQKALEAQSDHTTPTVRFNVRYNQVQQVTPLGSPAYSPVSSSDGLQSVPESASTAAGFARSHTQLSKVSAYDQLTSGYCPSVDTCSSATSAMTNPRQGVAAWAVSAHEMRERDNGVGVVMTTPPTARHMRRGSGYHPRMNDEPLNCAATEIGLPSYCTANANANANGRNRFTTPDGAKRHLDFDAYQALQRYPTRKDDFNGEFTVNSTQMQIVHPVQPYRVVETGRKTSDQIKRPDAEVLKNPVSILKVSANAENVLSNDAMRRASAEFPDRHCPVTVTAALDNDQKTPLIFANLTTEQAKNADKTVKFIPLVKVNVPEPCDADAQSSDANTHVAVGAASQLSSQSQSQSSSTNSTGVPQIPSAQPRNEPLPVSDLPQSANAAKACCAKSCAFCTAENVCSPQKGPGTQQCTQQRSSDGKSGADVRKHPERTFSHFYTERV